MNRTPHLSFLLAAFCLFQTVASVGQQLPGEPKAVTAMTASCGTDEYHQQRMLTDTAYLRSVQNATMSERYQLSNQGKGEPNAAAIPGDNSILIIPVIFVVYHLGEPVGQGSNVPDAVLQTQIDLLNKQYGAISNGATDTRIRFALAKRTATCASFNGIFRIDGRSVPGYEALGVDYQNNDIQNRMYNLVGPGINQMGQRAIIVRVYWQVTGAGGWAGYGGEVVAVGASSMNYGQGYNSLLAHEIGHVLFLRHTFDGSNGTTCPPNANPILDGDQVSDTPPHRQSDPSNACSSTAVAQINTCTGLPFGNIGRNIMSYGCGLYMLTPGQADRMRGYLGGSLNRFVDSPYLLPIAAEEVPAIACVPTSGVSATLATAYQQEGIRQVRLGRYQRQTLHYGNQALLYQPADCQFLIPIVRAGQSYTIGIDAPFNNRYRRVYADWNNDGSFNETTELASSSSIGEDIGTINVPANALTSQALRVRVLVCDGSQPPTACFVPTQGAVHDFALRVEPGNTLAQIWLGQLNSLSYCTGQAVLLPYTLSVGYDPTTLPIQAELSDETGTFGMPLLLQTGVGGLLTAQLPTKLPPGTAYRIRLIANGLQSILTPALTIRQTPSGYMTTPAAMTTIIGRPVPFSLVSEGSTAWLVATFGSTPFYGTNGTQSLTSVATQLASASRDLGLLRYEIASLEANGGCQATSLGTSQSVVVTCSPPESLTETEQGTTWLQLRWEDLGYGLPYYVQWKLSTASAWTDVASQQYVGAHLSNLTPGATYNWRIAIGCPTSQTSVFSPPRSFSMSCPMPTQLYEITTHNTAAMTWNQMGVSAAELRWRVVGSTTWNTASVAFSNQWSLPNPVVGQLYEWQVRNSCSGGMFSEWTAVRTFTVGCGLPQGLYVANVGSTSAVIGWWTAMAGLQYRVRWRVRGTSPWTTLSPTTSSTIALTNLPGGYFVEYALQVICADASVSPYSATQSFLINCPATATSFTLTGVSASSALLSYTPLPGFSYNVSWSASSSGLYYNARLPSHPATTFALRNLTHNTAYNVQLYGATPDNYGCPSATTSFTTVNCPLPGLISLTSPTTAISGMPIQMTASLTGTSPWAFTLTNGDSFSNVSTSPFSFTTQFQIPDNYSSYGITNRLTSLSNTCGTSYYPVPQSYLNVYQNCFTTPTNLRFERMAGANTAWLVWDNAVYTQHRLQWRVAGNTAWTTVTLSGTSYYLNGLTAGQTYEWQVEAFCTYGQSGYGPSQTFTVPTCAEPYELREATTPTATQLLWYYNAASSQTVRWRQAGQTTWNTVSNVYSNYTLNNLTANTAYEWQVQTVCTVGGSSGFTPIRSFTTVCGPPDRPTSSTVTSTSATMNWGAAFPGVQYTVRQRVNSGPGSWLTNATPLTTTTTSITGLMPSTTYEVQVQAVCSGGQRTAFTESAYIFTACQTATATLGSNTTISPGQSATLALMYVGSSPLSATLNNGTSLLYVSNVYSSPYSVVVSPGSTTTYTLERVSNNCGGGIVQGGPATVTIGTCTTMQTVMAGYWANPAIWSCGRVPTLTDVVTLRHAVTVSGPAIWPTLGIRYAPGGQLFYQPNAQLRTNR